MRNWFFASLFLPIAAFAQTKTRAVTAAPGTFVPSYSNSALATPTPAAVSQAVATPTASFPIKISYFAEYQGPALGYNSGLQETKNPGTPPEYAEIDHSLKISYPVSKLVTVGTQFRGANYFDPSKSFSLSDQRFYSQWSHMMETPDVDISGKLTVEIPTTSKSRTAGKLVTFKIGNNVEFKTPLRNWSFTFSTLIQTNFYNDPVSGGGKTDFIFGVFPYVTVDLFPNIQLLFEGSFDFNHNYNAAFYDYIPGDPNYIDLGPIFTIGPHINTNIALREYTGDFTVQGLTLYANIGVAL